MTRRLFVCARCGAVRALDADEGGHCSELYPDWERHERGHLADGARKRVEVVWLNPACSAALAREQHQHELPMEAGA